jgi:hypothetical protein
MSTPRPQADTAGLIDFLWTKCDCHTATREDLEWIGGLNSAVEMMATGLSDTLSSVGCLISADQHEARVSPSGAFQAHDLPQLLWHSAATLKTIGSVAFIASEADFLLRERLTAELEATRTDPGMEAWKARKGAPKKTETSHA